MKRKNEQSFDAVHMMRQLRDRLGEQCKDMTFEEQKQYIRERLSGKPPQERPKVHSMPKDIEARFHQEMLSVYRKAKDECHYNATRFLQMVSDQGGLQAAKALLHAEGYSEGLTALWELGRLDISMEAVVIQQPWSQLFTEEELATARRRLQELGYTHA
jgi:uncharacterized protein with NAD-binding domain and iron-sulfur cluster